MDPAQQQTDQPVRLPRALAYLRWPKLWLLVCACLVAVSYHFAQNFGFDASSDTLVVEGDPDLARYNRMVDTFGGDAFLFLTFAPADENALSAQSLATLQRLVDQLEAVPGVSDVFSVLDAPLLKSPPISLTQALDGLPTLTSPGTDLELAVTELTESPFFKELLISRDGKASAMKIDLLPNEALGNARDALAALRAGDADASDLAGA